MDPYGVVEEAETRRERDAAVRQCERQLCDGEEAEQQRTEAWGDDLTDDEFQELQRDAASAGRSSLHAAADAPAAAEPDG
ncbi:hypothetical protein D1J63_00035 [Streptomyces sp. KPB2]|uniref:hypothetical protein n=1 Tax=unclassified Streptomyces TaxID=2593676 RepID=UPI000F6DF719|nr:MULTISPECIES: hypothetical protein [unclassified Streptomyces]AZM73518.1 hypothetical protein D1J63_00035 [Streptomyces sp. KPB2]QKW65499.1 hypothetical protein HUT15_35935 [Streptomyces sp. NA03103]